MPNDSHTPLGPRLGRARSQNVQSQPQTSEDVCPASRHYSIGFEDARNSSLRPFKAVARVQIPLGPPTEEQVNDKFSPFTPSASPIWGRVWPERGLVGRAGCDGPCGPMALAYAMRSQPTPYTGRCDPWPAADAGITYRKGVVGRRFRQHRTIASSRRIHATGLSRPNNARPQR